MAHASIITFMTSLAVHLVTVTQTADGTTIIAPASFPAVVLCCLALFALVVWALTVADDRHQQALRADDETTQLLARISTADDTARPPDAVREASTISAWRAHRVTTDAPDEHEDWANARG